MQIGDSKKWMVAVLFIGTGIALGNVSERYGERKKEEERAAALVIQQQQEALAAAFVPEIKKESTKTLTVSKKEKATENQPKPYEPAPDKLNLAYFYPEDAESEEIIDSYAGQVFQELTIMDLDWLADLYELSDISPSTMASRLGKGTKAIMGGYNPRDKAHKANNPSSWVIHDWKKIHVQFVDGDGRSVRAFSNVKDILSMASVYTYYTDMMDIDAFAEYSRQLWKNSHSYSLSMGDVYYCSGCLNKTEEELVREAEEEELAAEKAFSGASELTENTENHSSVSMDSPGESGVSGMVTADTRQALPGISGYADAAEAETDDIAEAETIAETETTEESKIIKEKEIIEGKETKPTSEAMGDSVSAVPVQTETTVNIAETAGIGEAAETEGMTNIEDTAEITAEMGGTAALGNTGKGSGVSGSVIAASPSELQDAQQDMGFDWGMNVPGNAEAGTEESEENASSETTAKKKGKKTQYDCPGHVDLSIRVKILGLNEKKNLFSLSKAAEQEEWEGWTEENMASVQKISSQDWFDDYGLSISSFSLSTPLTNQEIDQYMNQLPADTSVTRRNIIHFALSSVGRVPYYWGGKAAFAGYEGNDFGALIPADDKGRMLKGLDCSGWVSWVYWSATGKRLAGESTSSLCLCGKQISRSDLQPGDIIVRTGAGAHVVMFLSWSADGRMNVIHETSGSMNNVTIATMDAPWPYYRKLVD